MIRSCFYIMACVLFISSVNTYASTRPGTYISLDLGSSLIGESNADLASANDLSGTLGASSGSFALGYRFESNNRIQISRSRINVDYESDLTNDLSGTDLDWHIVYGDDGIQPYWGFGFGIYTLENSSDSFVKGNDLQGRSFQVLTGLKFDLDKYVELDLSYRIKNIDWQEMVFVDGNGIEKIKLSHTFGNLNVGATIKF
jgi:opacity protein-like surface antigen